MRLFDRQDERSAVGRQRAGARQAHRVLAAAMLLLGGAGCERPAPSGKGTVAANPTIDGRGLNVLLVSVDTTRADCLGCYGHPVVQTPNVDRLAAQGTRFAQCFSPAPITLPAHSTMMTGSYQFVHGARDNAMYRLGDENQTLAELFQEAGFATHAAVAALVLDRKCGLGQGFDTYDDLDRLKSGAVKPALPAEESVKEDYRRPDDRGALTVPDQPAPWALLDRKADEITRHAVELLKRNKDNPFFIFLHYFDPHQPASAPRRFAEQYADGYFAELAFFDEQFGLVMDTLRELGLAEKTLVILTSDHGEGRGDHGEQTHSYFVYDATLHVPLIMSLPGKIPAGQVVESQVRLIDLAPTIVDFAGLERTPQMQGTSLLPLLADVSLDLGLPVYADTLTPRLYLGYSPLRALRHEGWKYILSTRPELYNVADDPRELFNLARAEPQRAAAMREQLRTLIAESPAPPSGRAATREVSPQDVRKLASLGYMVERGTDTAEEIAAKTELEDFEPSGPSPADNKEAIELMNLALGRLLAGEPEQAETTYRRLLELEPNNAKATKELADAVAAQHRYDDAVELYRQAIELEPERTATLLSLGRVLALQGDLAGAEKQYRRAAELDDEDYTPLVQLANVLARQHKFEEAFLTYQAAATLAPHAPSVLAQWGLAHAAAGQADEAEAKLRQAIDIDPRFRATRLFLAQHLSAVRRNADAIQELNALLEYHPHDVRAMEMLASIHTRGGEHQVANQYYERIVELESDSARGVYYLGRSLALAGKTDQAIAKFKNAIELEPDFPKPYLTLAEAFERTGQGDQAIQTFERMLERIPSSGFVYTRFANLLDRHGRAGQAIARLRAGRVALPGDPNIANDLAWRLATCFNAELRNGTEAVEHAEHAKRLTNGRGVNVLDTLAAAYAEAGGFDQALANAKQAAELATAEGATALAQRIAARIELYEGGQPYHAEP